MTMTTTTMTMTSTRTRTRTITANNQTQKQERQRQQHVQLAMLFVDWGSIWRGFNALVFKSSPKDDLFKLSESQTAWELETWGGCILFPIIGPLQHSKLPSPGHNFQSWKLCSTLSISLEEKFFTPVTVAIFSRSLELMKYFQEKFVELMQVPLNRADAPRSNWNLATVPDWRWFQLGLTRKTRKLVLQ